MYLRLAKGRADENWGTDEQSDDVVDDETTRPIIQILSPFLDFPGIHKLSITFKILE